MTVFRVGMKVVCVDDDPATSPVPYSLGTSLDGLQKGNVYIVCDVGMRHGYLVVCVAEITRPMNPGYSSHRFRPVAYPRQSAEHDAALFRPILDHATIDDLGRRLDDLGRRLDELAR